MINDSLDNVSVLIVEDDKDIARILRQYAESCGAQTHVAADGVDAVKQHRVVRPDIILLDINLPGCDGFEVLTTVRAQFDTPTIILSARMEDEDKLNGLSLGADDYVIKPFNPREVMARIKAVLHRSNSREKPDLLRHSGITIDLLAATASAETAEGRKQLRLTHSEYKILELLMQTPNKVFSREEILEACFPESEALSRTVDSHVSHLRKKLDGATSRDLISVVRGIGYRFGAASEPC